MSVWSVEAVTEFIRLFREHACLWMVKSRDYTNRNKRNEAYDVLVKFCKTIGFPSANREFVTKKIQNLRGAFRKELKKVTEARKSGSQDVYQPSLWYYDLLLFIEDQELPTPSVTDVIEDDFVDADNETLDTYRTPSRHTVDSPSQTRLKPNLDHITVEVPSARGVKRKFKPNVIDNQFLWKKKLMNVCTEALKSKKDVTEYEALAISIGKKLEKMDYVQAIHAETIIHNVLRRGLLNQLTEATDVCDRQCAKVVGPPSVPRPRPSSSAHSEAYHSSMTPKLEIQDDDPLSD